MAEYLIPSADHPAYPYMIGNPTEIIGADSDPRIFLASQHPTEDAAALLVHAIVTRREYLLRHVDYACMHPKGAQAIPRYRFENEHHPDPTQRGTDMNRSWARPYPPRTYEEKQAALWQRHIETIGYDYVLDGHTTTTDAGSTGRFLMTARPDEPAVQRIIAASPYERIVVMPLEWEAVWHSLIGQIVNSVVFEHNQAFMRQPEAVEGLLDTVERLALDKPHSPMKREFYYVTDLITEANDPGPDAPNFIWHKKLGAYPLLNGRNSYRDAAEQGGDKNTMRGLAATHRDIREM